jgi:hypothetical protein
MKKLPDGWWNDEGLAENAATVCAFYDILGRITDRSWLARLMLRMHLGVGWFFTRNWAPSIVSNYETLASYIQYRRETQFDAYRGFTRLYERAKKCNPVVPQVTRPASGPPKVV